MTITPHNRDILRRLACQVAEIAALPIQQEKVRFWKALNGLRPVRPLVMIDQIPWHEMDVDGELTLACADDFCRNLETALRRTIYRWKHLPADRPVDNEIVIPKVIRNPGIGIDIVEETLALDPHNDVVAHRFIDQVQTDADIEKIRCPEIYLDEAATAAAEEKTHAIFDGIIPVRMQGSLPWFSGWDIITAWRGAEKVLWDLAERPDFMHRLIGRLVDVQMRLLDQFESKGLLGRHQSLIHCTGAYTDELPAPGFDPNKPRAKDLWTFGMAQVFSSVSPDMFEEFEVNYMIPWYRRWGLVYYGCCDPLDDRMDRVRKLPNVRKVSMSPWVNVERGAREIGRDYVFSGKPNPAFLAAETFDPDLIEADLRRTIRACAEHGCPLELILKDISTVRYQPQRIWQWEKIAMRLVQEERA